MSTDERRRALQRDIERRLPLCALDELRVVDVILGRLELGRERYGELHIARDRRDYKRERAEELVDAEVYDACDLLQRRDAERAELYEAAAREAVTQLYGEPPVEPRSHVEAAQRFDTSDEGQR